MTGGQEEDEFWQIALIDHPNTSHASDRDDGNDDHVGREEEDDDLMLVSKTKSYHIPSVGIYGEVNFRLAGLSTAPGMISSPLGAHAWYGSALLSALLLKPPAPVAAALSRTRTALELGSGAVGLSAMTLTWVMAHHIANNKNHHHHHLPQQKSRIILTDHDPLVLRQLQANMSSSRQALLQQFPDMQFPDLDVVALDWSSSSRKAMMLDVQNLELVMGSELVYTTANATACANIVLDLLRDYPQAFVVIVQVTDREGWNNVFLPTLSKQPGILVQQETIDADVHELASQMIPMGGVLDRFDFGVCYVSQSSL